MAEKRIFKRRELIYYMKVLERDTDKLLGYLVDVTTEGLMIMCEAPLEIEKNYALRINLRKDLSNKEHLHFDAKCKWCTKEICADFYDAGLELLRIAPEDQKEIENIIEKLCFK